LNGESELPEEIAREVDEYIDSLECLEVLLLMYRDAGRVWCVEQVAGELRRLAAFLVIMAAILDKNRKPK
jgi:hypothetical protein